MGKKKKTEIALLIFIALKLLIPVITGIIKSAVNGESGNDEYKGYTEMATQADMDNF